MPKTKYWRWSAQLIHPAHLSIAPQNGPYRHSAEGPDDMPAHIKAALTQTQLTIPLQQGRLALGTWQGIYVFEHRDHRQRRRVVMHLLGD